MALTLGEGWAGVFADRGEAVRQAQEGLDEHGVKMNVGNMVQPDSAEGYLVATTAASGESTAPYRVLRGSPGSWPRP